MGYRTIITKSGQKIKVDSEDYDRVSKYTWYVVQKKNSDKLAVVANVRTKEGIKKMTLGKYIMKPKKGKLVYPRRSDLDFRKSNLIVCTMAERQQMLPKRKGMDTTSRFKGVGYDANSGKWRAYITEDSVTKTIGFFDSEEKAARAYNQAAKRLYGEFSYMNQFSKQKRRKSDK